MSLLFLKTVGDTDENTVGVIVGMKRVGLQQLGCLLCDFEYVVGPALRVLVVVANVIQAPFTSSNKIRKVKVNLTVIYILTRS